MRHQTLIYSLALLLLLAAANAPPAPAQQTQAAGQTETELLRAIACEIRELRAVIQQGHILVPLLEANRREREFASQQLAEADKQLSQARTELERWISAQRETGDGLRELARAGRQQLDAEEAARKKEFEAVLKAAELEIRRFQGEEARLFSESGQIKARLSRLEDEFDRMQRQMQAMATVAGSVCESSSQAAQ
jgi:hypothetical protein